MLILLATTLTNCELENESEEINMETQLLDKDDVVTPGEKGGK